MMTPHVPPVSMAQLIAEARLRHPDVDLLERIRAGREALNAASDCEIDAARREAALQDGLDVAVWLMALIDSAHARSARYVPGAASRR